MNKKIFLAGLLTLATVASVVGTVGNTHKVSAYDLNGSEYVYFEVPSTWTEKTKAIMVGHDSYSICYEMTQIANTDIYYVKMPTWGGYNAYGFLNTNGLWGGEGNGSSSKPSTRINWAPHKTKTTGDKILAYNIYSGDENNIYGQHETSLDSMNMAMKANISDSNAGTVTVTGYKLTSATAVTAQNSADTKILKYTDATFTATVNEGYTFDGWYTAETGGELKSSELSFKVENVYEGHTYYARYSVIPTTTPSDEVNALFAKYYGEGSYTKDSVLNTSKMADNEVAKYFHASADIKYRKTVYTSTGLTMTTSTDGVTYEDESKYENGDGNVVHTGLGGNWTVNRPSVEEWFVTLKDFVDASTTGWEYEDGVYSHNLVAATATEEDELTRMAREFVAPMWLAPNANNYGYASFTKLTVKEDEGKLVMKLYIDATDSGILVEGSENVFSQVTIY